jgi:hypothetical protein
MQSSEHVAMIQEQGASSQRETHRERAWAMRRTVVASFRADPAKWRKPCQIMCDVGAIASIRRPMGHSASDDSMQILWPQMGVALEHLPITVARNKSNLFDGQSGFK